MLVPRRLVPSISSLRALEAVDRLGSASAAAEELALTHSAVSRQIKTLEGQLEMPLVFREGAGLKLTPAAREYCETVRTCLRDLSQASLKLRANPTGGSLNLAILPAFGVHWLAPKLRDFATTCPEVSINLSSRLEPIDFQREHYDAAIHYGVRDWHGVHYLHLSEEHVLPLCAPSLLKSAPRSPEDLLNYPLLHLESRPNAWHDWFAHYGVETNSAPGMLIDQFSTMAQAAVHRLGIAVLPLYLAEREIKEGRLVSAFGDPVRAPGDYYLVWPERKHPKPALEKFIQWVTTSVEAG